MRFMKRLWLFFFAALAVAIVLHSAPLVRHFHNDSVKTALIISGPRTDIGDNYHYFTLLRHAPERLLPGTIRAGDPDKSDHRNINAVSDTYAAPLYLGHLLYRIAAALTGSSRDAALLTSIFHTCLLAMTFAAFLVTLLGSKSRGGGFFCFFVVAYCGLLLIDAFGNSLYFGQFYWADNLLTYYSNPTRMVNPTLLWAAGLAAGAFIVRWLRNERTGDFLMAVALAGLTGLFSIGVGATLLLALGLSVAFDVLASRTINWRLLAIAFTAFFGLVWNYLQLRGYLQTALGQELRHGEFLGLVAKWEFLLLLGLVPFIWRTLGKERVFIAALLVSAMLIGMFCESFHLGSRLWLRGAVIYVWAAVVFVIASIVLSWLASCDMALRIKLLFKAGALISMVAFVYQAQKPDVDSWKGFIEREKWELLDWMDQRLPDGSVVASGDIEDAFLLPIYTGAKPLYAMYGLTNRSRDEELRRYFYTMKLFGVDRQLLEAALRLNQKDVRNYHLHMLGPVHVPFRSDIADAIIFLELVLYHAHVRDLANALVDPTKHQQLERILVDRAEEASRLRYAFDFAVVENSRVPSEFSEWTVAYENSRYSVLRNPWVGELRT